MFRRIVKRVSHGVMIRLFTLFEVLGLPGGSSQHGGSKEDR